MLLLLMWILALLMAILLFQLLSLLASDVDTLIWGLAVYRSAGSITNDGRGNDTGDK